MKRRRIFGGLMPLAVIMFCVPLTGESEGVVTEPPGVSTFSKRFEFSANKEIPLDVTVGRVHFDFVLVEVESWKSGGHYLRVLLQAMNPDGHDQTLEIRAQFLNNDGKVLAAAEGDKQIEEGESKRVRIGTDIEVDPATSVTSFDLSIRSWDD